LEGSQGDLQDDIELAVERHDLSSRQAHYGFKQDVAGGENFAELSWLHSAPPMERIVHSRQFVMAHERHSR
jgi:hypothetical protein